MIKVLFVCHKVIVWNHPRDVQITNDTTAIHRVQRCHAAPYKETSIGS